MPLPSSMRAIAIDRPGGPEVLVEVERPLPVLEEGEILIEVEAAGVNRPDILQRSGAYPPPKGASDLPGLEVAGMVVATSFDVNRFKIGDRVCALTAGGGYAAYAKVHESNALAIPAGLDMAQAAALPETFFTVWHNVFERGKLTDGETLLLHGATSGIGVTAILLAKSFGAIVIVTSRSAEKAAAAKALGADVAIDASVGNWAEAVMTATAGRGVDLILDMVGGDYAERNIEVAATEGRIVQIATLAGAVAPVNLARIMMKRLTLTGSTMRPQPISSKARIARALEERVWPLLAAGRCRPPIHATFPLERAGDAHRLMESGTHVGKIVLTVGKVPAPAAEDESDTTG